MSQSFLVFVAQIEKPGVRREVEGPLIQPEERLIHGALDKCTQQLIVDEIEYHDAERESISTHAHRCIPLLCTVS